MLPDLLSFESYAERIAQKLQRICLNAHQCGWSFFPLMIHGVQYEIGIDVQPDIKVPPCLLRCVTRGSLLMLSLQPGWTPCITVFINGQVMYQPGGQAPLLPQQERVENLLQLRLRSIDDALELYLRSPSPADLMRTLQAADG